MSEQEYITARLTRCDKIASKLFYIPVIIFALGIIYFMFMDTEMEREFFAVVLILFIPSAYLNHRVSRKIGLLRNRYYQIRKKNP